MEKLFIIIQTQWTHTPPSSYFLHPRPYTYIFTHTHTPLLFPTEEGKRSWNRQCRSLTPLYHCLTCFAVKQLVLVILKDLLLKKCPRFPSKSSPLLLNSLLFLLNDIFIVWKYTLGKKILGFLCHSETYVGCNIRALSKNNFLFYKNNICSKYSKSVPCIIPTQISPQPALSKAFISWVKIARLIPSIILILRISMFNIDILNTGRKICIHRCRYIQ